MGGCATSRSDRRDKRGLEISACRSRRLVNDGAIDLRIPADAGGRCLALHRASRSVAAISRGPIQVGAVTKSKLRNLDVGGLALRRALSAGDWKVPVQRERQLPGGQPAEGPSRSDGRWRPYRSARPRETRFRARLPGRGGRGSRAYAPPLRPDRRDSTPRIRTAPCSASEACRADRRSARGARCRRPAAPDRSRLRPPRSCARRPSILRVRRSGRAPPPAREPRIAREHAR